MQDVSPLSVLLAISECLMVGVGLGLLGTALVACAIPILFSIPAPTP